jgi:hypothetical protein
MKLRKSLFVVAAVLMVFGMSGAAFAFHGGGVAECEGCHTMHNSLNGDVMTRQTTTGFTQNSLVVGEAGPYLLQGTDQSSTCLNCHAQPDTAPKSYHILTLGQPMPTQRTPGGDFAWLTAVGGLASRPREATAS